MSVTYFNVNVSAVAALPLTVGPALGAPAKMPAESKTAVPGCTGTTTGVGAPAKMPIESRRAVPGCAVPSKTGFATTLLWLCTATLILVNTAKLTTTGDFLMVLLSGAALAIEQMGLE